MDPGKIDKGKYIAKRGGRNNNKNIGAAAPGGLENVISNMESSVGRRGEGKKTHNNMGCGNKV